MITVARPTKRHITTATATALPIIQTTKVTRTRTRRFASSTPSSSSSSSVVSTSNPSSIRTTTTTTAGATTTTNSSSSSSSLSNPLLLFRIYYNDVYKVDLPPRHRFPMSKYERVRKQIQSTIASSSLSSSSTLSSSSSSSSSLFHVSPLATTQELETTHSPMYIQRFLTGQMTLEEQRNVGFPWSTQGVNRALSSVGGTIAAACYVCEEVQRIRQQQQQQQSQPPSSLQPPPWAAHVAGGTHHAFYDYGEGFSIFSDIGVASNVVLERYSDVVQNILIIDLDVHQGNGNCKLFENNPHVFTFSIHCDANIFSQKEFGDLDIELPAGCTDATYLMTLNHWLNRFREAHFSAISSSSSSTTNEMDASDEAKKNNHNNNNNGTSSSSNHRPFKIDLIFFQAGVDILSEDRLGRMDISSEGVKRRNEMVYQFATDVNAPLVVTMGGGYPKRDTDNGWDTLIDAHTNVYVQAYEFLQKQQRQQQQQKQQQ